MTKKKLAVCAVFANAAPDLPEWLAYHHVVGVEHFVLYDNGSTDDPSRAVRGSPLAEHVTLIHWPRQGQVAAYRHFIDIFAPGFEWAAFLELDEFLLPLSNGNVVNTLEWLSNAAAVLVHRRVFGPGSWQEPPPGLTIENYDRRAADDFPASRHVRAIVRCNELLDVTQNPHEFRVNGPVFNTAGHLAPNSAVQEQPCFQNLVINHYYARSRQDLLAKLQRHDATADAATSHDEAGLADQLATLGQVQDVTIQAYAPAVRRLLGIDPAPSAALAATPPPAQIVAPAQSAAPAPVVAPAAPSAATVAPALEPTMLRPVVPDAVAAAIAAALTGQPTASQGVPHEPPAQRNRAVFVPVETVPGWVSRGQNARERVGGLALVFRDRSRAGEHWLAALRGTTMAAIDPAFLLDDFDRIRDFPSEAEARAACDAALAQEPRH